MLLISSIHNPPLTPPPPSPNNHFVSRAHRLRRYISFESTPVKLAISPRLSLTHAGRYPPPDPNLELHSAAASGNVGLVQYALTHGQPVNSVLHGVLPLHAACSGGSISVVRMLLENGADVNAPRLPRRYSDGKRGTAPSVGTAGSTPLHFAAANGHAPVVQMLLASGADPTKPDKNANTAEDLAEINGHDDVVRVLHVYHHLKSQDAMNDPAQSDRTDPPSPSGSNLRLCEEEDGSIRHGWIGSRKGKERAYSLTSTKSDGAVKVKKSLEGLLMRRGTRYSAGGSSTNLGDESPRSEVSATGPIPRIGTASDMVSIADSDGLQSPAELDSTAISLNDPGDELALSPGFANADATLDVPLNRVTSGHSSISTGASIVLNSPPNSAGLPSPRGRLNSTSSHRPTLPSILEKAVHPGQAFRAAFRHQNDKESKGQSSSDPSIEVHEGEEAHSPQPQSSSHSHSGGFFRGRRKSQDQDLHLQQHKKHNKHGFKGFFRRGHSPPSRSPSPPPKTDGKPIAPEELEEGIQRLKRASLDMERREDGRAEEDSDINRGPEEDDDMTTPQPRPLPASAPATKTKFFPDSPTLGPPRLGGRRDDISSGVSSPSDRSFGRARTGSEVIAPSPLANEWAHDTDDSDSSAPQRGIRRVRTEVIKTNSLLSPLSPDVDNREPPSPKAIRPRSATHTGGLPSPALPNFSINLNLPRPVGLGWEDEMDLRKVAASSLYRRESQRRQEEEEAKVEAEGDEEEEFYDAISPALDPEDATPPGRDDHDSKDATPTPQSEVSLDAENEIDEKTSGRLRGSSIGSTNSNSSRLSTPSGSAFRMSTMTDSLDDAQMQRQPKLMGPPALSVMTVLGGRARGPSVSSTSSGTSGMGFSYIQSASSPSTSLTPPSAISLLPASSISGFPPVPENEVAPSPPIHRRTMTQRTVSSHAEAKEVVKQNESDILQLAQLPPSLNSSRSLAEQLAAYGENVAIQQKFEAIERRASHGHTPRGGSEDGDSYVTAESERSRGSTRSSEISRRSRPGDMQPRAVSSPLMPAQEVDPSRASMPAISNIYDKRADAYRKHMAALSAAHPVLPTSTRHSQHRARERQRAASSHEMWLDAGPMNRRPKSSHSHHTTFSAYGTDAGTGYDGESGIMRYPHISNPMPVVSNPIARQRARQTSAGSTHSHSHSHGHAHGRAHTMPRPTHNFTLPSPNAISTSVASTELGSSGGPTPIANILSTRYQGLSKSPSTIAPSVKPVFTPIPSSSNYTSTSMSRSGSGPGSTVGGGGAPPVSPYVSIFSHRYAATPLNEDESDDEEQERREYTVIENDWRGGHIVRPDDLGLTTTSEGKKGKWGLKKMGLGRK